jgi:hypothetical protein
MKGVVFTEFLEMAEDRFSLGVVDSVLRATAPASGGVYTSVGTYPVEELVGLLVQLSEQTRVPVPVLLKEFGGHLLRRFVQWYPEFFADARSSFDVLQNVEGHIHVEVRKLYPDAELPTFECNNEGDSTLLVTYRSPRRLADLAEGLMQACAEHFGEQVSITREELGPNPGEHVRFRLERLGRT